MPAQQSLFSHAVPVFMKSFGRLNPDKVFYVIWREGTGGGMFSNVFHVLSHLMYARDLGLTPVVDMENFPTHYTEQEPINGTKNSWEYYFTQPAAYRLDEVYKSKRVIFCYGANSSAFGAYYDFEKARQIARGHLTLQPYIVARAEEFRRKHFDGKKVLGVHFRGQEMKTTPGHPVPPSEEQMVEKTRYLLEAHAIDKIFVVSEEQAYVDLFREHFGDRVLFSDAFRTYAENAYHIRPYPRPLHMYKLGLEVLIDTLLLARTDYFLAGGYGGLAFGSGVSMMAQLLNDGRFQHMELVYNGIQEGTSGQRGFLEFVQTCFPDGRYTPIR